MGYDQAQKSSSSGALIGVVVVVLIVALVGILGVLGAGFFFVRTARVEAMVSQDRAVAASHRAEVMARRAAEEARAEAVPEPKMKFEVKVDREGNASVEGEKLGLDDLKAKLETLKEETSNAFSVQISADSECPLKHVVSVMDLCKEVGDIDFNVAASGDSGVSSGESSTEN